MLPSSITISRGLAVSPHCAGCPCARNNQPVKAVRASGVPGGLCIVGEGPGGEELLQGYPFVGPSGKIVTKGLKLAGVDRGLCWITNALLCKRPFDDQDLNIAVEHCSARLRADLATGQPTAICALGGTAMRALLLPVTLVSQARGTVQYSPLAPGVPVIGSIHPAALLRGGAGEMDGGGKQKMNVDAQAQFLFSDIEKIARVADGTTEPEWSDDIEVIHEPARVVGAMSACIEDCYTWGILGLDLEWTCDGSKNPLDALGAGAPRAQITWVGIGCEKRAASFKWEVLLESGCLPQLQAAMEDPTLAKLCHNKQADKAVWEAQVGPIKGRILDTLLMHHAAFPGIDHDLQQVTSQFLCVPPWKVDHAREIAQFKAEEKQQAKVDKAAEKEQQKAERKIEHERKNAEKHAQKLADKERKRLEHEAKNAKSHADKEARKAAKRPRQLVLDGLSGRALQELKEARNGTESN